MNTTLTVATYNIQFGRGRDGRFDLPRIAAAVQAADIIAWQEVTQNWRRTGFADQAAELARLLGHHFVFGAGLDVFADPAAPGSRRTFGNMVSSRWPIRSARTLLLPKRTLVGVFDLQRSVTEAVVDAPHCPLRVYSLHLSHISSQARLPQVRALLDFVRDAPLHGAPWDASFTADWTEGWDTPTPPAPALVMGDFNMTAGEPEYDLICGQPAPRRGRPTPADGLADLWVAAGHDEQAGVTCLSDKGRIDHIFATPDLIPAARRAWIDEVAEGSDHQPLFAQLDLQALRR